MGYLDFFKKHYSCMCKCLNLLTTEGKFLRVENGDTRRKNTTSGRPFKLLFSCDCLTWYVKSSCPFHGFIRYLWHCQEPVSEGGGGVISLSFQGKD